MSSFISLLNQIACGQDLSDEQAESAVRAMMSGDVSPALSGAFLWGLKTKGESVQEIAGAARAMRSLMSGVQDRKSTRLNSSHSQQSRMPSSA